MQRVKEQKGITLIALVITIIVMLILVGVTISVSLNGGLFSTAKEATGETQIAQEKEELLMAALGALGEDGKVDIGKLDSSLPEGFTGSNWEYTSKTGNVFKVSENGSITLTGGSSEEEQEIADHNGITIPTGATYYDFSTGTTLLVGEQFPETVGDADTYKYGDYIYIYDKTKGWGVSINTAVTNKNQTSYGEIIGSINNSPVKNLNKLFSECKLLTISPTIPESTTTMYETFYNCTSLTEQPIIPSGVQTRYEDIFYGCTQLGY